MEFIEKKRTSFFALPIYFTKYIVSEEKLTMCKGLLNLTEDDALMYKIQDVKLKNSLLERIFGLGTVICYTGDVTHPEIILEHIRRAREIKDFIMESSEQSRHKHRTIQTMDIDVDNEPEI